MSRRPQRVLGVAAVVFAIAGLASASFAAAAPLSGAARHSKAPKTRWNRIDGPTGAGNEIGLVRGADGVLHAIWIRGTTPSTISDTRISTAGRPAGTTAIASGWDGNGGIAGVLMPDHTLRLFVTGGHVPSLPTSQTGVNSFTAPVGGSPWTLDSGRVWGGTPAYDAGSLGAALTSDGQPVTAWAAAGTDTVHVGLDPNSSNSSFGADTGAAWLATDAKTGAVTVAGPTVAGAGGTFVQQILPSPGASGLLASISNERAAGLAGRLGAGGVYVAFTDGKTVKLALVGGGARRVARGPFQVAKTFAATGGRLWVVWGDDTGGFFVTRSNGAATRFEPVQHLRLPRNTAGIGNASGEGSAGPLDLFALLQIGASDRGYWQTHVSPKLSIRSSSGKRKRGKKTVTITISDAGDPVSGARVKVGSKKAVTDAKGHATFLLRPGTYSESASSPGYAGVTGRVKVKG